MERVDLYGEPCDWLEELVEEVIAAVEEYLRRWAIVTELYGP